MKYHLITLPFDSKRGQFLVKEWEEFSQAHHVLDCQIHFFNLHHQAYWTLWITYESHSAKEPATPEFAVLNQAQQQVYEALKTWRNERAHKDGITHYLIAKNVELEQIARIQPSTASGLLGISGFGKKKVAKYAEEILAIMDQHKLSSSPS